MVSLPKCPTLLLLEPKGKNIERKKKEDLVIAGLCEYDLKALILLQLLWIFFIMLYIVPYTVHPYISELQYILLITIERF